MSEDGQTVLILGAGASAPYGFLTGQELQDKIKSADFGAHSIPGNAGRLRDGLPGFTEEQITEFKDALRRACLPSVDSFLDKRQGYDRIGKAAIAAVLLPGERKSLKAFYSSENPRGNWYPHLWSEMQAPSPSLKELCTTKLSIVTFNYDRSLEYFISTAMRESHRDELILGQGGDVLPIDIVHTYGVLARMYWDIPVGDHILKYGEAPTWEDIENATETIKLIHERGDVRLRDKARGLIQKASTVIFLGFGYHKDNLDHLGFADLDTTGKTIVGTCHGMKSRQVLDIPYYDKLKIEVGVRHQLCSEFLKNMVTFRFR